MSQVRKPKRLGARSFRLFLASSDNARPSRKFSLSLKSFMRSIAFRLHSRKFVMYEFRYAKEHPIARTFHKAFQLVERCLLLGLMVAVSLEAQQSSLSAPAWAGVVLTAAGEPVAGAKVTVYTAAAKEKMTAVTGSDGTFAIADIRPGPHTVSVQRPGRRPKASTAVDITGIAVQLGLDAGGHLARRGGFYEYRDTIREKRFSRIILRVLKELRSRCAELFRSPIDCGAGQNSSIP